MRTVKFENKTYCIRDITFPFGERTVGTEKLNDALMTDDGGYVSEEAKLIDESIFYFVEENNLCLQEKELVLKIISEI
jgi:hypothetical protein